MSPVASLHLPWLLVQPGYEYRQALPIDWTAQGAKVSRCRVRFGLTKRSCKRSLIVWQQPHVTDCGFRNRSRSFLFQPTFIATLKKQKMWSRPRRFPERRSSKKIIFKCEFTLSTSRAGQARQRFQKWEIISRRKWKFAKLYFFSPLNQVASQFPGIEKYQLSSLPFRCYWQPTELGGKRGKTEGERNKKNFSKKIIFFFSLGVSALPVRSGLLQKISKWSLGREVQTLTRARAVSDTPASLDRSQ